MAKIGTLPTWNEIHTVKPRYSIVITIIFSMLYMDMGQPHSMIQQFCQLVCPMFLFPMYVSLYVCMINPKYSHRRDKARGSWTVKQPLYFL